MGIGRPLTPTALCEVGACECYCYSVLGMQDLLLALLSKHCRRIYLWGILFLQGDLCWVTDRCCWFAA